MAKKANSFEESLTQLETIMETLDKGDLPLDKAINYFEKGMQLAKLCENILSDAQKKVDDINMDLTKDV